IFYVIISILYFYSFFFFILFYYFFFFFFFFFQAEDGIRDYKVTGVQTCGSSDLNALVRDLGTAIQSFPGNIIAGAFHFAPMEFRSEERRVGKECRSRWSPYH